MSRRSERDPTMPRLRVGPWLRYAGGLVAFMTALGIGVYGGLGRSLGDAVISGVIYGVIWSVLPLWLALRARRRRHQGCSVLLTRTQREAAVEASLGGPVPSDLAVRFEAIRLLRVDAADPPPKRPRLVAAMFAVIVGGLVIAGWFASPWWWLVAGLVAVAGSLQVVLEPHLRRRQAMRLGQLEAGLSDP